MIIHREYRAGPVERIGLAGVFCLLACVAQGFGQTFAPPVAPGDEHAQYDLLRHYRETLVPDSSNYEALWRASAAAADLAEFHAPDPQRDSLFALAERYARRAVTVNPTDAEGHFELARALGRKALTVGMRERAKYAVEVREQALATIAANPSHAGGLHVLGVWNQQVMQLSVLQRTIAKLLLGAKSFGKASWAEAVRSLEDAAMIEPNRIVHRLDLGRVYAATKRKSEAREQYLWIRTAPLTDYNDRHYKQEAEAALRALD